MNIYEQSRYLDIAAKSVGRSLSWKEKLAYLTSAFLTDNQIECPVSHRWEGGMYVREMKIPAGTLFIGRPHKLGHLCSLKKGSLIHFTEQGSFEREAIYDLRSSPGYQVALYAITDVVGETSHPDDGERDIEKLEDKIFESLDSIKELGLDVSRMLEGKAA